MFGNDGRRPQSNSEQEKLRSEIKATYEKGDYEKCKELTTKALALNPKDHLALYFRASSKVELGFLKRDGAGSAKRHRRRTRVS